MLQVLKVDAPRETFRYTSVQILCRALLALLMSSPYRASGNEAGTRQVVSNPELVWERPGDLQIGVILSLTAFNKTSLCGNKLRSPSALHRLHAIIFALEEINRRNDILPHIKLGFVVMDDCSRDAAALLRALHFIQMPGCQRNQTLVSATTYWRSNKAEVAETSMKTYQVVGIIGAELSESSMQMAALLSAFRVPQLSYASSSPFLSDKNKYGFFSRIVPSDHQQALVIVNILQHFQWNYVAVVYSYDVYGLSGFSYIRGALEEKSFCLAAAIATESEFRTIDYDRLIEKLLMIKPRVNVVVLFTLHASFILRAARRQGLDGRFVWVSSDGLVPNVKDFKGYEDVAAGLLLVGFNSSPVKRFEDKFQYYTLRNSQENPWFAKFYEVMFNCTTDNHSPSCDPDLPLLRSSLYERNTSVMRMINCVYAFAHALHNVTKNCTYTSHNVSNCFTPEELLLSLRQIQFIGENGVPVGIDAAGDGIATYQIRNLRVDEDTYSFTTVGEWDGRYRNFTYFDQQAIMWHPRQRLKVKDDESEDEIISDEDADGVPSSTCREDCGVGQEAEPTWPRCCWICKTCRENERVVQKDGLPTCVICPTETNFTWPDEKTRTLCEPIDPVFVSFASPMGLTLLTLDVLVLALVLTCTALYIRNRESRLIKATSRELSGVMLCGHLLACLALPVFLVTPSTVSCLVAHTAFHVSLTLVYSPLLVKINRIHRIFLSGKRSGSKPRLIGTGFQLAVSLVVVIVHLLFIALWMIYHPPGEKTRMLSVNYQRVERICAVSETGFMASLLINLVLMAACAVHSLSTRQLPANYNEAKFIMICVYTIAVLWLSFLATYFVMDNGAVHTLCLSLALLVNVISCQVFLFIPKLYAVYKLPSSKQDVQNEPVFSSRKRSEHLTVASLQ